MVRLSKPQRTQDGDRMGLFSGLWKPLLCVWKLLERKQVTSLACAMVSSDNSIWHQKMSHLSTQPCSCQCVNIPECGLPLLGVTRSHPHHRHKQSANSRSWWEQSRHVSWHTCTYQEANVAAPPLLGQVKARFCLAATNKIGCTAVH